MVSNLFGTIDRVRYIFRDTLATVRRLVELKVDPADRRRAPAGNPLGCCRRCATCCRGESRSGAVLAQTTSIDRLPQLQSWPDDGGAFITLPPVYTEDPDAPGLAAVEPGHVPRATCRAGNIGRTPRSGCTIKSIAASACTMRPRFAAASRWRVNIFVGGPPAMSVAAVMPLPEGLVGVGLCRGLGRPPHCRWSRGAALPVYAEADFCITGIVEPERQLPEGPFGDHLGYYSLAHDYPVLRVEHGSPPAGRDLAVHGRRPAAARGHDVRPIDPRADRPGHSQP